MEEEKKCHKVEKKLVSCPKDSPKDMKCHTEKKIEVPCKKRCIGGVLGSDVIDKRTGERRLKGSPCLDSE